MSESNNELGEKEEIPCTVCGLPRDVDDTFYSIEGIGEKCLLAGPCVYTKQIMTVHPIAKDRIPKSISNTHRIQLNREVRDEELFIPADEFQGWVKHIVEKGELPEKSYSKIVQSTDIAKLPDVTRNLIKEAKKRIAISTYILAYFDEVKDVLKEKLEHDGGLVVDVYMTSPYSKHLIKKSDAEAVKSRAHDLENMGANVHFSAMRPLFRGTLIDDRKALMIDFDYDKATERNIVKGHSITTGSLLRVLDGYLDLLKESKGEQVPLEQRLIAKALSAVSTAGERSPMVSDDNIIFSLVLSAGLALVSGFLAAASFILYHAPLPLILIPALGIPLAPIIVSIARQK